MTDLRALLLSAMLLPTPLIAGASAGQLPGRVVRVVDGDSLVLDVRGAQYRVELSGIDAPELNQPWGTAAGEHLHRLLTGAFVVVGDAVDGSDGVVRGTLVFRGRDVGLDLLYDGLAWADVAHDPVDTAHDHPYLPAEQAERSAGRGLWSDADPVPPWEWRRQRPPGTD